jgi:hypothetical protein
VQHGVRAAVGRRPVDREPRHFAAGSIAQLRLEISVGSSSATAVVPSLYFAVRRVVWLSSQ